MKLFVTEKDGPIPGNSGKKHKDPLDKLPEWMEMKAFILSGKAKPMEAFGFHLYPKLDDTTGVDTTRTARDRLRRFLKDAHLESDYHARMVVPDREHDPDHKFLRVWYEPPMVAAAHTKKKRA